MDSFPDIRIEEDSISFYDENGQEVVGWVQDEWVEDPAVVLSIANAISVAYKHGMDAIKIRIGADV